MEKASSRWRLSSLRTPQNSYDPRLKKEKVQSSGIAGFFVVGADLVAFIASGTASALREDRRIGQIGAYHGVFHSWRSCKPAFAWTQGFTQKSMVDISGHGGKRRFGRAASIFYSPKVCDRVGFCGKRHRAGPGFRGLLDFP